MNIFCVTVVIYDTCNVSQMDNLAQKLEQTRDLTRTMVHVDMDAFYAAVEMRDCPELKCTQTKPPPISLYWLWLFCREKPMAIGSQSMLSTSNYHARRFGVRAAMPGFIVIIISLYI